MRRHETIIIIIITTFTILYINLRTHTDMQNRKKEETKQKPPQLNIWAERQTNKHKPPTNQSTYKQPNHHPNKGKKHRHTKKTNTHSNPEQQHTNEQTIIPQQTNKHTNTHQYYLLTNKRKTVDQFHCQEETYGDFYSWDLACICLFASFIVPNVFVHFTLHITLWTYEGKWHSQRAYNWYDSKFCEPLFYLASCIYLSRACNPNIHYTRYHKNSNFSKMWNRCLDISRLFSSVFSVTIHTETDSVFVC